MNRERDYRIESPLPFRQISLICDGRWTLEFSSHLYSHTRLEWTRSHLDQSFYLCRPKGTETLRLCSREVILSNGPRRVKSGKREEEMRLFLSVCNRCNANKVWRQTCKLNPCLRVEVYFIFDLWVTYRRQENSKVNRKWNYYIALVDHNKIFLVHTFDLRERRIFQFWDKITNFGFACRNVHSDNLISGRIQVGLEVYQRSVVRYTVPFE